MHGMQLESPCLLCHLRLLVKLATVGWQAGGAQCSSNLSYTVISVFAPIFRTPRCIIENFWNHLDCSTCFWLVIVVR